MKPNSIINVLLNDEEVTYLSFRKPKESRSLDMDVRRHVEAARKKAGPAPRDAEWVDRFVLEMERLGYSAISSDIAYSSGGAVSILGCHVPDTKA